MMTLWYTTRGVGLALLIVLSLSTSLGMLASVPSRNAERRFVVQYAHRAAAVFGLGLLVVHVGTVLADSKAYVGVAGAFVPFASSYRPGSVALGSIAAYLLLIVLATGLARRRMSGSDRAIRLWRLVHLAAYASWGLAVLHGLNAGTDSGTTWVRLLIAACVAVVLASLVVRLRSLGRHRLVDGLAPVAAVPVGAAR